VLGFRINIILAAIIFFYTYAYHQDDPSNILLGIILSIVVVFCHKIFDCVCTGNAAKGVLPSSSKVIRDGKEVSLKVNAIVPGDILLLESGDRIPVDCRFISTDGQLLVDFSLYAKEKLPREISTSSTDSVNYKTSLNVGL
jgi:magnesium-transporting ATPase (P-type)